MIKITELFEIKYPKTLTLVSMTKADKGINFVSSKAKNNGVSAIVEPKEGIELYPAGSISVPLKGSVMCPSLQVKDFYCAHQTAVLIPKVELSDREKIFYILALKANKYKYNYGRQADRTLREIMLPSRDEIPSWVYKMEIPTYDDIAESKTQEKVELPPVSKWKNFEYDKIFNMNRGQGGIIKNAKDNEGENEFITSSSENNGVSLYTGLTPTEKANTITVANNGSVGEAFFHTKPYLATSDVTVLDLKDRELNSSIAMFLITLIRKEQFKFNYGRKWGVTRMKKSIIKLPVTAEGKPDYDLMERYINSLPYSKYI